VSTQRSFERREGIAMKKLSVVLLATLVLMGLGMAEAAATATDASFDGVRVTYVGNAGFLITVGDKKVLIDAMFDGFAGGYALPGTVRDLLENAQAPFDGVDLILVTHDHADHFSTSMVRQHMTNNPDAILVSTTQVTGSLVDFGSRVISLAATARNSVQVDVGGIHVEAMYLSHGTPPPGQREIVNFGYVVTIDGVSFFHMGDMDAYQVGIPGLRAYGLSGKHLDLAFIQHFYLAEPEYRPDVVEAIAAQYIVPMHLAYTYVEMDRSGILRNYPGAVLFATELESWVMPEE
jgi:L-ascorbate metabolism protein UlaG (beta-lactamase superfamily)